MLLDTLNTTYTGIVNYRDVAKHLEQPKETGKKGITGNYGNLKVWANPFKLKIVGSADKFMNDENYNGLTMDQTKEFITLLSDVFDLDLMKATVNRIDNGTSFLLKEPPAKYRSLMIFKPKYFNNSYPNTTYFHNATDTRVLCFYDKGINKDYLKFENRFTKTTTIKTTLKLNQKPTVADVIKNNNLLLKQWKKAYFTVIKSQLIQMQKAPTGIKDINNYLWALAVNDPTQRKAIEAAINLNENKKTRYKMRQKIRRAEKFRFNSNYDLIKELDCRVIEAFKTHLT